MSAPPDSVYLQHILEAIAWIESYLEGISEADFRDTKLIQDGVIRQLEIIGEAVKRLSPAFVAAHPGVPWSRIARMRDKLIRDYFGVDVQVVWDTTQVDVPRLKAVVLGISGSSGASNGSEHRLSASPPAPAPPFGTAEPRTLSAIG